MVKVECACAQDKRVKDVMTPMNKVYMIEAGVRLSFEHMLEIYRSGYTRIPVYDKDPQNIIGILYTKDLILVDPGALLLGIEYLSGPDIQMSPMSLLAWTTNQQKMWHWLHAHKSGRSLHLSLHTFGLQVTKTGMQMPSELKNWRCRGPGLLR